MASTARPTGCYKCGQPGHWSRDCPSQPPSQTPSAAPQTTPSSSGFSPSGTQRQGGTQAGTQAGTQRWQGSTQGYKRKEPWGSGSFVPKEKPVKAPVQPRRMPKLTPDLLLGSDGLGYVLEKIPRQVTIRGRGHEVEDLKSLLEAYLRWHQNLLPYFSYSQFVEKVEKVGSSKRVRLCVRELRQKVEKGEKFSSVDMNVVLENEEASAEEPSKRYETFSEAEEDHADPPADVLEEHLREATASVQAPAAAPAPTTRPVLVIGQEAVTLPPQDIKEEQRARMEANKQKALERARARKLESEKANSSAPP